MSRGILAISRCLFLLFAVAPAFSHGQLTGPMTFTTFEPCGGNSVETCGTRILAQGMIESDSDRKLVVFLSNKRAHDEETGGTLCFNSPGGDLAGAIALGRLIRKLGLSTCLAPEYSHVIPSSRGFAYDEETFVKNVLCASACAFALVGGVNRTIENGSRYGVHQFFGARGNIGDSPTQVTIVALAAYLQQMGINRSLLDMASLTGPNNMYWLAPQDLRAAGVDNTKVVMSEWRLDALNDGSVVATISQVKPGTHSRVSLTVLKRGGQPILLIGFIPDLNSRSLEHALEAVNGESITLLVDGRQVAVYHRVSDWRVVRGSLVTTLPLSSDAIAWLRTGKLLDIDISVPRYRRRYDPSLQFPLDRMNHLLSAGRVPARGV